VARRFLPGLDVPAAAQRGRQGSQRGQDGGQGEHHDQAAGERPEIRSGVAMNMAAVVFASATHL
jgi:hypothetical protein